MATAMTETIQALPDATKGAGFATSQLLSWTTTDRAALLAPWGTRERERQLRAYYRHPYNTLVQGAFGGLIKKVKNTPWEITGGRTRTNYFSTLLREAQFGRGWGDFLSRVLLDYLRHDVGAFIEIIAPGNPKRAPTGRVVGLAHLDAIRCYLTGDPDYPVLYYAMDGKMHLMHHTRVLHLVDMPDGDEEYRDYGLCALSRAIAVVERQMYMNRYIRTKLDDLPPPGIVVGSNLNRSELERAIRQFTQDMSQDTPAVYGRTMWLFGMNPQETAELNVTTFSQPPEGFDYEKYMGIDINLLALAIGVDRQELWELSGANIGSATQSEILHAKSQGKAYGDLLTILERSFNRLFPEDIDFQWKVKDPQEQQNTATNAQTWVSTVRSLDGLITPELQVRILANQVRAVADAVIDENGDLVRMNDVDPEAPETDTPTPADDNVQNDVTNRTPGITGETGTKELDAGYVYIDLANDPALIAIMKSLKSAFSSDVQVEWTTPATYHVTLAYSPSVSNAQMLRAVASIAADPFTIRGGDLTILGHDGSYALCVLLDKTPALADLQNDVALGLRLSGAELSPFSEPSAYKPHVTLAYLPDGVNAPAVRVNYSGLCNTVVCARGEYQAYITINLAENNSVSVKSVIDTREAFTDTFNGILTNARSGVYKRVRLRSIMLNLIREYGNLAYLDGKKDGGVDEPLTEAEEAEALTLLSGNREYVNGYVDTLLTSGFTDAVARGKAELWWNKSVEPFYQAGRLSADQNGMYEWKLGRTEKHCTTCATLHGQRHRLRQYRDAGLLPKSDKLACRGFLCDCSLIRTKGQTRPRGRLPALKEAHDHAL